MPLALEFRLATEAAQDATELEFRLVDVTAPPVEGPDAPTGLTLVSATTTSITVSWTDNTSGAAWHRVYFRVNGTSDDFEIGAEVPPATVQAEVGGQDAGTTYELRATAFDGDTLEESEFSAALVTATGAEEAEGIGTISGGAVLSGVGETPTVPVTPAEGTGTLSGGADLAGLGGMPGSDPPSLVADLSPDLMARII